MALCMGSSGRAAAAPAGFAEAVEATHPLAFFRLDATSGSSAVGSATYTAVGGVTPAAGPPVGEGAEGALAFNGVDGYVDTTQRGGIGSAGSFLIWVNLATLPAKAPHILYVGGESENGNDFDIQFESDNALHFYTAAGSNIKYAPETGSLLHRWHMIVATLDVNTKARAIYWDGKAVARDTGGGKPDKTSEFSLAESKVFTGRFFSGSLDEAALWNRALTASEVAAIYAATLTK